jgi:hypothetical protein
MDRSLVHAKQSRPGCAQVLRHHPSRVARECVRLWREGRMTLHAGYVGRSAGFAGMRLGKLHELVDPVAGPIELARWCDNAALAGTLRSRSLGYLFDPRPFDAPRDLLTNIRRSSLR